MAFVGDNQPQPRGHNITFNISNPENRLIPNVVLQPSQERDITRRVELATTIRPRPVPLLTSTIPPPPRSAPLGSLSLRRGVQDAVNADGRVERATTTRPGPASLLTPTIPPPPRRVSRVSLSLRGFQDAVNIDDLGLKIGEKVIWFTDNGQETATVGWIGVLNGAKTAGIIFKKAIGSTDGVHDGVRYFQCGPNHGRFVDIGELLLYAECIDEEDLEVTVILDGDRKPRYMCVVCREDLLARSAHSVTKCGHVFHAECLKEYLKLSKICPDHECEQELTCWRSVLRLYLTFPE